jgi:hypothetical protein
VKSSINQLLPDTNLDIIQQKENLFNFIFILWGSEREREMRKKKGG